MYGLGLLILGCTHRTRSHFIQTLCDDLSRLPLFAVLSSLIILSQLGKAAIINLYRRFISFLGSIYLFHVPVIITLSFLFV